MKIFLIAMPGCGNFGDDLISELLQEDILKKYPKAEVGVLCGNNSKFKLVQRASKFFNPRYRPGKYYNACKKIKQFIKECDIIFVGGGGLFQDTHYLFTIHSFLHWIYYAHCPVVCVGMGVGPIRCVLNSKYLQRTLNRPGVKIQLRDIESYNFMRALGFRNIEYLCDIVEGSSHFSLAKKDHSSRVLGCSIRPWKDLSYTKLIDIINNVIKTYSIEEVHFFAFEHVDAIPEEYMFLKSISSGLKLKSQIFAYGKDPDFLEHLQNIDYAIASRYHANIVWQKMGIPVIPIPYAPKVFSLYAKKGVKLFLFNSNEFVQHFISINMNDKYVLPDIDVHETIVFSKIELFIEKLIHLYSMIHSVCCSVFQRLIR